MDFKEQISASELENMLQVRNQKKQDFILVDVREKDEYEEKRIFGVNLLLPSSNLKQLINNLEQYKNKTIVLYCRSGMRSFHIQQKLKSLSFSRVVNLERGIIDYLGKTISN